MDKYGKNAVFPGGFIQIEDFFFNTVPVFPMQCGPCLSTQLAKLHAIECGMQELNL